MVWGGEGIESTALCKKKKSPDQQQQHLFTLGFSE